MEAGWRTSGGVSCQAASVLSTQLEAVTPGHSQCQPHGEHGGRTGGDQSNSEKVQRKIQGYVMIAAGLIIKTIANQVDSKTSKQT